MSQGSVSASEQEWGRVDEDGNVFVRTADGERAVGQSMRTSGSGR